jgi:hypothetical protein
LNLALEKNEDNYIWLGTFAFCLWLYFEDRSKFRVQILMNTTRIRIKAVGKCRVRLNPGLLAEGG